MRVTTPQDLAADLDLALALADTADAITMAHARRADLRIETKADQSPVTEADQAAEEALRQGLAAARPSDAIVGEEYGGDAITGRRWILDPIDGTKNYMRGVPVWATLIALADDDGVAVGVVSAPALGRRWWAARGSGAWTTEPHGEQPRRIHASDIATLADASFSFSDTDHWDRDVLHSLMDQTWRTRAYGDFWSHMLVAEGAVEISAEIGLSPWDVAALVPVVEEAGGVFATLDTAMGTVSVATNSSLHGAVRAILQSAAPPQAAG